MDAVILAGGLGTRLRSLVPDVPKPMAEVEGRPFLEYQLRYWIEQGIDRFVLSVGYKHEAIVTHFGGAFEGARVDYAIEEAPLGTGGGLLLAIEELRGEEAFLLLNGDTFFEVDLAALRRFHSEHLADLTMCLFESDRQGRYMGITLDENQRVVSLAEASLGGLVNGGVYLVGSRSFAGMRWKGRSKISLESELLPAVKEAGKGLFGFRCNSRFIDIGVPEDYLRSGAILNQ